MAAAEDLCRGLVCSMLLFCVVASLWCIANAIAVAIRDQAISIAVESFAAMGNQQSELASGLSQLAMALQSQNQAQPKAKAMPKAKVAAQPPVNNQEEAQEGGGVPPVPPFPPFPPGLGAFSPVYPPGHGQLQDQFLRQCRFCKQVAYWREGICVNVVRVTWLQLVECPVCFVSLLIF